MNIILYQHPYLNSSSTIRLLLFRAVANLLFTITFIPAYLYSIESSNRPPNIPYTVHINDTVEIIYWKTLNVLNFATNVFNTISVWLTLCVTFQLTGLVVWPMYAKNSLPLTVSTWVIAVVISLATLFHGILLLQRDVVSHYCPDDVEIVSHRYLSKSPPKVEEFYYQMQAVLVNILPLLLLIICCVTIGVSSCKKSGTSLVKVRKSSRTQCLLNLAGATTICHFTFEVPSTAVQIAVTFGALFESTFNFTSLIAITNFLIMCNAAFPFLIYIGCSKRYRNLALFICGIRKKRCRYGVEDSTAQRGDERVQGKKKLLTATDDEERELCSSTRLKRIGRRIENL
uniref:G_PROTEIN_RECEP_F1_2 domain-containing protein n=1 Tax=Syphacia muris TaxID=451379 RepID=A0A0N5ANC3_9BILA